jgi:hypothetical protein
MNAKTKIRLDSIEQAHRALEALPEHCPEEVTKTQAIQRLIAPIRATQSKGYSLAAIGKVLSDSGIPITTGALRAYVSEAMGADGGRKKHKTKRTAKAHKQTQPDAKTSPKTVPPQSTHPAASPSAPTTRNIDVDWDPSAPKLGQERTVGNRQGIYVRPDTKDI